MQGNTPIKRCRPLPLSAASKDGFVPVTGVFGRNQCDDCCDDATYSRRNNDCGCDECCDNATFSQRNNSCGCDECCDNATFSQRDTGCGCNDCCDNATFSQRNNGCGCQDDCCDNATFSRRDNSCGCDDCCDNATFSQRNNGCGCDECCDNATYSSRDTSCGCDDCCDNATFSRRDNSCGCDECCDNATFTQRNNGCGCQNGCSCRTAGMVYSEDHCLNNRMKAAQGIRHGTLFTELHKPFAANPCPSGCASATNKQELAFAAWELRLYLNTHPNDKAALKLFEEYERRLGCANYATTFVPGCKGRNCWTWNSDPWPWEVCANSGKE